MASFMHAAVTERRHYKLSDASLHRIAGCSSACCNRCELSALLPVCKSKCGGCGCARWQVCMLHPSLGDSCGPTPGQQPVISSAGSLTGTHIPVRQMQAGALIPSRLLICPCPFSRAAPYAAVTAFIAAIAGPMALFFLIRRDPWLRKRLAHNTTLVARALYCGCGGTMRTKRMTSMGRLKPLTPDQCHLSSHSRRLSTSCLVHEVFRHWSNATVGRVAGDAAPPGKHRPRYYQSCHYLHCHSCPNGPCACESAVCCPSRLDGMGPVVLCSCSLHAAPS